MIDGIIVKGIGGFYYVSTEKGIIECKARGKFRKQGIKPMVGDRVSISVTDDAFEYGAIEEIGDRLNFLIRPPVSNIECIVIVVAATKPQPDYFMIDKLMITAERNGIEVIVAVNKTDLMSADEVMNVYKSAGYGVIPVCANTGDGIDELKKRIEGKITAFAGNSGVGKSSILNNFGFDLQTGEVSKIERGKHTTRHVELFCAENNTFVIDTPGFSILDISDVDSDELKKYYPEFTNYNDECRFANCNHFGTTPDNCAVARAVKDGIIAKSRYDSYTQIYDSLKEIKKWEK